MAKIVFVADLFADQYMGGAELTTEALIEACPFEYVKINSADVTIQTLQNYQNCFWVFGNFSQLNFQLIPSYFHYSFYNPLIYVMERNAVKQKCYFCLLILQWT